MTADAQPAQPSVDASAVEQAPAVLLALEFYRDPMLLRDWQAQLMALPAGVGELIRLAGARTEVLQVEAIRYQVEAESLGESARFFLQQVLLAPGAGHYRVLGVEPDADDASIKAQHRLLMRLFHPDRHVGQECWTDAYATRVNQAYGVLKHADSRASYDREQPASVVVGSTSVGVGDAVPGLEAIRRARVRGPRYWNDSAAMVGDGAVGSTDKRSRTLVFASLVGVALLLLGWIIRGNQSDALVSTYAQLKAADRRAADGYTAHEKPPVARENGISAPRLVKLDLADADKGEAAAEADLRLPNGGQTQQSDELMPPASVTGIPPSRQVNETRPNRRHTALVIPPARAVDIPEPKGVSELPDDWLKEEVEGVAARPGGKAAGRKQAAPAISDDHTFAITGGNTAAARTKPAPDVAADAAMAHQTGLLDGLDSSEAAGVDGQSRLIYMPAAVSAQKSLPKPDLPISERVLMSLLGHLVNSYQTGDLVDFISLFSDRASTSDEASRSEIENEYRRLFSTTKARQLQVSGVDWRVHAGGARGEGFMVIQIKRAGRGVERYEGRFTVHITREQQELRISGLYYDLERT